MSVPVTDSLLLRRRGAPGAQRARGGARWRVAPSTWTIAAATILLAAVALFLHTRALDASLWIDDAQSVGIASHPVADIPHLLRRDGAPPLYYVLLSLWIDAFGTGERALTALSVGFSLACVGAALWAAWVTFGRRAGLYGAGLAALTPLLAVEADQVRMYTLLALLSLLATGAFVQAFVRRRRGWAVAFGALLALMLYTQYWSAYLAVASAAAAGWLVHRAADDRRALLIDAALAHAGALAVFAPWLPTLAFQLAHTGAPWSQVPGLGAALGVTSVILGASLLSPVGLVAGAGLARGLGARHRAPEPWRRAVVPLAVLIVVTIALAWIASQISPNWAPRYFVVLAGPVLVLAAGGMARAGRLALVCCIVFVPIWAFRVPHSADSKSNVRPVLAQSARSLRPGDLVIATQPEELPAARYYLHATHPGLRYATPLGPSRDPAIMDWRNAVPRLRRSTVAGTLKPLLASVHPGQRLLLIQPIIKDRADWRAPWTRLVRASSLRWRRTLGADPRFELERVSSVSEGAVHDSGVQATVFRRRVVRSGSAP